MKKDILIGIIGGKGKMGCWFVRFFRKQNFQVLVSDVDTKLTNKELALKADVVIIAVPLDKTVEVIKEIASSVRSNALLTDITSIKSGPVCAMLASKAEVIGMHPVFGPTTPSLENQTIVICPARTSKWFPWITSILEKNGARIKITTASEHDRIMATIQGLTHFSTITLGYALKEMGINIFDSLEYASPIYRLRLDMVGRILAQNPRLYADIEILNPEIHKTVKVLINSMNKLAKIVESNDIKGFIKYFNKAADYLGDFKKQAMIESDYVVSQLATEIGKEKQSKDIVSMAIYIKEDRPGLLYSLLGVFAEYNINLTKIESHPIKKELGKYVFYIDFEGKLKNKKVQKTLSDIKNKKGVSVKILGDNKEVIYS